MAKFGALGSFSFTRLTLPTLSPFSLSPNQEVEDFFIFFPFAEDLLCTNSAHLARARYPIATADSICRATWLSIGSKRKRAMGEREGFFVFDRWQRCTLLVSRAGSTLEFSRKSGCCDSGRCFARLCYGRWYFLFQTKTRIDKLV